MTNKPQQRLRFIFMNGRGSSGKDTQADLLLEDMPQAVRISTGDIVRGSQVKDSAFYKYHDVLEQYISASMQGGFIPDEVMLPVVQDVVAGELQKGRDTFIFTGFPRTEPQLKAVDEGKLVPEGCIAQNDFLCLAVLESQSRDRAGCRRREDKALGRESRKDDLEPVVETRLQTYKDNTLPMLRQLTAEGRLRIIKSNGTIPEVRERVRAALGISSHPVGERPGKRLL